MFSNPHEQLDLHRIINVANFYNPLEISSNWPSSSIAFVKCFHEPNLDNIKTCASHGTSLHSLRRILETGVLQPGAVKDGVTEGHIYFVPKVNNLQRSVDTKNLELTEHTLRSFKETLNEYADYDKEQAKLIAEKHAIINFLDLDFSNPSIHSLISEYLVSRDIDRSSDVGRFEIKKKDFFDFCKNDDIPEYKIQIALDESQKFSGVLIGLNVRTFKDFKVDNKGSGNEAPRFVCAQGIEIAKYFTCIVPLGPVEKRFLDSLK